LPAFHVRFTSIYKSSGTSHCVKWLASNLMRSMLQGAS
jgi:hypothetical protein